MISFTIEESLSFDLTGFNWTKLLKNLRSRTFFIVSHSLFSPKTSYIFCNKYFPKLHESQVFFISVISD